MIFSDEDFIKKCEKKFPQFDYSQTIFNGLNGRMIAVCPKHGKFDISVYNFLNKTKYGCQKCGRDSIKKGQYFLKEILDECKEVHGNKYKYNYKEHVGQISHNAILTIYCKTCKQYFKQDAYIHRKGCGCGHCNRRKIRIDKDEFIRRAVAIHGENYDYSYITYVDRNTPVRIYCHNCKQIFEQKPKHHMNGSGCNLGCQTRLSLNEFISRARVFHGDKYNYDKVVYVNYDTEVIVTCKEHGDFLVSPNNHFYNKTGCPKCGVMSKGETIIASVLNKLKLNYEKEKTFKKCINPETKGLLRFDFFVPEKNLIIEYDGIQHFNKTKFSRTSQEFQDLKKRDHIKTRFARENKYQFLRIPYYEFNNIESILKDDIKVIVGIDPGASGGVTKLIIDKKTNNILSVNLFKMPIYEEEILYLILQCSFVSYDTVFFLENVHAMPSDGKVSAWKFGKHCGFLRGCLISNDLSFMEITPQVWQKSLGILKRQKDENKTKFKNRLKDFAQKLFPNEKLTLSTCDSLLLAEYGRQYLLGNKYEEKMISSL